VSFVTRKHLPRRTVLRGLGASVALPMLDAMRPAFAAAEPASPLRLVFTYVPNGVTLADWAPAGQGRDFELSRILKPLEPYRDRLLVLSGLAHKNGNALGDGPGDHARAGASFLTGVHPRKTAGADIKNGVSVDQIAARAVGEKTRLLSLELGCEESRTVGNCDSGYSCAYTNSISWRSDTTPNPPETNPRMAFERLFGADEVTLDAEARARRAADRRSVLDFVAARSRGLAAGLGPSDRRKLDEYLTGVREIERQIERAESDAREVPPPVEKPSGIPAEYADYVKLMFDLQVAALQADLTRVVTFMMGREGSLQSYPEIGVPDSHHPLTHHRGQADLVERVTKINVFHVELFAHLVGKLAAIPDGDSTLLDRVAIVYGSGLADGDRHTHEDLPVLVVGGGLGNGRHLVCPSETPMTNLFLTLLERVGVGQDTLGDSTGRLSLA
jgi:Protein of unknown function (DUF1552)